MIRPWLLAALALVCLVVLLGLVSVIEAAL